MGQLIGSEASQQIPMARQRRSSRRKPFAFGRRHGVTAKRVFPRETCTLEFFCGVGEPLERRPKPRPSGGKIPGDCNDEAKAVLRIPKLHLSYEPRPIHVREREHHPGQRFYQAKLKIVLYKRFEEDGTGIYLATAQVHEAWISEAGELACERLWILEEALRIRLN